MNHPKEIYECPAFVVFESPEWAKYKHGDKFRMPFESARHGVMWHEFSFGSVAGYAIENGECPVAAIARCEKNKAEKPGYGHKLYWVNACSVCLHNGPKVQKRQPGMNFGDEVVFQGHRFRLEPASNQNVKLVMLGAVE